MPKLKGHLKQNKKKRKDEPVPETADDYQAAGVELEEAAGKHRAGDPLKAMRFFERAMNTYDEGLARFPENFDLAYNKARVQYEVATHPSLARQMQHPIVDVLRVALASHEYALKLDESDADLLFNTSQVMTSIAEELASEGSNQAAIELLLSAVGLQTRCLSVQEQKYAENAEQDREVRRIFDNRSDDHAAVDEILVSQHCKVVPAQDEDDGQWALVLEPVVAGTLIDTVLACFASMTTLCTALTVSMNQSWEDMVADLESHRHQLLDKIEALPLNDPKRMHELAVADAILQSAMLDAAFTFNSLSAARYKEMLDRLWSTGKPNLDLQTTSDALVAHACALMALNSSLSTLSRPNIDDTDDIGHRDDLRWAALTAATKSLTAVSKTASLRIEEKAKTHLLLGDASFLQYRMSTPPTRHREATKYAETLLKNSQVFYQNAARLSSEHKDKERALFRCAVVQSFAKHGFVQPGLTLMFTSAIDDQRSFIEELQSMLDEGLLLESTNPKGHTSYV